MREALFALALAACVASFVVGVALMSAALAWMVGGILGALLSWAVLSDAAMKNDAGSGDS